MKKFGLIGGTLSHSFSKEFFDNYFLKNNLNASYENIEITEIEGIKWVFQNNFDGLNVTIPYKESIIPYLDELNVEAKQIGAVNTILFKNGKSIGFNTDAFGFHQTIKPFLTNHHERALVLGTGGASKAIHFVLSNIGVDIIYASRTPKNNSEFPYSEINENMLKACKLIINCTPLGMYPNLNECPLPTFNGIGSEHLVIDLIYNPQETLFLKKAKEAGATAINGLEMLKAQALKSWEIWKP